MSSAPNQPWLQGSSKLARRAAAAGLLAALAACGGDAGDADMELEARSSALGGPGLKARVRVRGHDPALERSGHSIVTLGLLPHVVRGVRDDFDTQTNTFPEDIQRLNPLLGSARALVERGAERPSGLSYSCTAADDSSLAFYLFGGAHYVFELDPDFFSSLVVSDELYRYDLPARRWAAIEVGGARPAARTGCSAEFFDGALYMFGGISRFFEVNAELWRFDPAAEAWAQLAPRGPTPSPRYKPAAAIDRAAGKIYYYGGLAFGPAGFERIDDFWVYDIASNTFRELPSGITPVRDQGAMAVLRAPTGKRYVVHVGGDLPTDVSCTGFPQLAQATDEVWAYDIDGEVWSLLPTSGMPRIEYHSGTTLANRFYFAGGWAEEPDPERTCRQEWNPYFFELSLVSR